MKWKDNSIYYQRNVRADNTNNLFRWEFFSSSFFCFFPPIVNLILLLVFRTGTDVYFVYQTMNIVWLRHDASPQQVLSFYILEVLFSQTNPIRCNMKKKGKLILLLLKLSIIYVAGWKIWLRIVALELCGSKGKQSLHQQWNGNAMEIMSANWFLVKKI